MKPIIKIISSTVRSVAPYVGAWIETTAGSEKNEISFVAPYVGAWIETSTFVYMYIVCMVAPYVGAWIETRKRVGYLLR